MTATSHPFAAEVSRLLDIVVHSLYSDRAIFLRELIANAADACEKLRYESLVKAELLAGEPIIRLIADQDKHTLSVTDNGIGMNQAELADNLGTIARSGTAAFLDRVRQGDKASPSMIGQFGVGFYSSFMVADKVDVLSRKAGEAETWLWSSDGKSGYSLEAAPESSRIEGSGTRIVLYLKTDAREFLEEQRLKEIVRSYADHIALPIFFGDDATAPRLNQGAALWSRPKGDITAQQYTDFYRYVGGAWDEPAFTLHWKAEGALDYKALLFVPSGRPVDLFDPKREHSIKLYVRHMFITDHAPNLVPPFLRFLRGVIDSEDLPLNVSREMLQNNPVLAKMRQGIVRKVISELDKWESTDKNAYAKFWSNFGPVLKEGLYEEQDYRDGLLSLLRARSTAPESEGGLVSLDAYISRMKDGQKEIYYIIGDDAQILAASPHIEGYKARGIEVLLLTDSVDSFWPGMVGVYKDKPFVSVTRGGLAPEDKAKDAAKETEADAPTDRLIAVLKSVLADHVKDVRRSKTLTDSPVCLIADQGDPDLKLERLLRQHGQLHQPVKRILEINPAHALIRALSASADGGKTEALGNAAWLLLDQARLLEGDTVIDPAAFAKRLSAMMSAGFGAAPTQHEPVKQDAA